MTYTPIGETKTIFGSTFILTDPQYISDLGLWRRYNGVPESNEETTGLGGILPIVVKDTGNRIINVSFDIIDLPDIRVTQGNKSFLADASTLLQTNSQQLPDFLPAGS